MKSNTLAPQSAKPSPRLFGRLGDFLYVNKAAQDATQAGHVVKWDDQAGTCEANTLDGQTVFRAIAKGAPCESASWIVMYSPLFYPQYGNTISVERETRDGKTYLVQRYQDKTITRGKTADGLRVFTITRSNGQRYGVPYDIARIAAGTDRWMRDLLGKCDCGANYAMHESDVPFCAKCQAEAENARADGNG